MLPHSLESTFFSLLLLPTTLLSRLHKTRAVHLFEQGQRRGQKGIALPFEILSYYAGVARLSLSNNLAESSDIFCNIFYLILVELVLKILQGLIDCYWRHIRHSWHPV
jgi:hypothetical protein